MTAEPIIRVLVVDDQEAVLADFARLLDPPLAPAEDVLDEIELSLGGTHTGPAQGRRGYHLRYVRQGADAVREVAAAAAAGSPFAVAFVDVQMPPGIDGVETVTRMWRDQPDLEVVLCTAYADYSWEALRERLTAHDQLVILRKPFDPIEVRQLAACMSEKWRRGRKLAERVISLEARVAVAARMQVELERAQKFEALGRLAAGIAHEISTPIQYIQSNLEFIGEGIAKLAGTVHGLHQRVAALGGSAPPTDALDLLTVELPQAIAAANDGVRRVTGIVRSIRDYAHPSRQHEPVDINRQIRAVVELARGQYKYDIDLVLQLGELPMVPGHSDQLGSVILNLLINAAQAIQGSRDGSGPRGRITVTSRATAEQVIVEVADTGPGIAEAHRDLVFELFYTTKPIGEGTGQGLAIARATVVDGHHGTLTFESEPGRGTTFRICLPVAACRP